MSEVFWKLLSLPAAVGVGRMADNEKAVLVSFVRPLTDDELRKLHDVLRALSNAAPPSASGGQRHEHG